jgi:hypothetical protein
MSFLGYFVSLVSTTFKLPYQRFPTLNQGTLQPLERPHDLWNVCNLNGGEWDDLQTYGRSFSLELTRVKH